jgi:hypothetical protein
MCRSAADGVGAPRLRAGMSAEIDTGHERSLDGLGARRGALQALDATIANVALAYFDINLPIGIEAAACALGLSCRARDRLPSTITSPRWRRSTARRRRRWTT